MAFNNKVLSRIDGARLGFNSEKQLIAEGKAVAMWDATNSGLVDPVTGGVISFGGGGIGVGRTITASTTAVLEDAGTRITGNHATVAIVVTIPNDSTVLWDDEATIVLYQGLAAGVSFTAGAGVTLRAPAGYAASVQYGVIAALRVGPNEWTLV